MLTNEQRQYIREQRSRVVKENYMRDRRLRLVSGSRVTPGSGVYENCLHCGNMFEMAKRGNHRYCSIRCSRDAKNSRRREERAKEIETRVRKCKGCEVMILGVHHGRMFHDNKCRDRFFYHKQRAAMKQREREEQLQQLAGY